MLYVDNDWKDNTGVPTNLVWHENAFASIENAIDNSDPIENNTIIVFPGVYDNTLENFPITINVENLRITSENGPSKTLVDIDNDSRNGFELTENNITLTGFTITDANNGFFLDSSSNNTLENNQAENNDVGFSLDSSDNNIFRANTTAKNENGFWLDENSDNNLFFHNFSHSNLSTNAFDNGSNRWENTALSEGNWWGDWQAPDNTLDADNDGVLDDPYLFENNARDNYPLALVTLESPDNGASLSDNTPTLKWTTPVLPTYQIQVDNDNGFSTPVDNENNLQVGEFTTSSLSEGTYYWRVKGIDPDPYETPWTLAWTFTIGENRPTADFSYSPTLPTTENIIQFSDNSTDPDGIIENWWWEFGDGDNSTDNNPTHTYFDNGTYMVTLTVTDDDGLEDNFSDNINVANAQPDANFYYAPTNPDTRDNITFTDNSTDPDGIIENWGWDFGDGSPLVENDNNPSYSYENSGTYTVTLTVTDDDNDTDSVSENITISNVNPIPNFTYSPGLPSTQEGIQFTDNSRDPDGEITDWGWEFGDGFASSQENPTHSYYNSGVYTVALTVTDGEGAENTYYENITVKKANEPPIAAVNSSFYNYYIANEGKEIELDATRSRDPDGTITYEWSIKNDPTNKVTLKKSDTAKPALSLPSINSDKEVTLKLTVEDDRGATDSATITVEIQNTGEERREESGISSEDLLLWVLVACSIVGIAGFAYKLIFIDQLIKI